jgi:hypothetical protein
MAIASKIGSVREGQGNDTDNEVGISEQRAEGLERMKYFTGGISGKRGARNRRIVAIEAPVAASGA